MSKVVTFSRTFPSYHPRKGEETFFVQKIWNNILNGDKTSYYEICALNEGMEESSKTILWDFWASIKATDELKESKGHTIRAGHRFKVGDKFSPRVWSGKPYQSKQIIIAPDIEVKKVWDIGMEGYFIWINHNIFNRYKLSSNIVTLASNDGLSLQDFWDWFPYEKGKTFDGQIICWDENINYETIKL